MLEIFPALPLAASMFPLPGHAEVPLIGAQVIIEPGQSPEEIETWFRVMKHNGLGVCRTRRFEMHMHKPDGTWDFSQFDVAFKMGEKSGICVFATIFPSSDKLANQVAVPSRYWDRCTPSSRKGGDSSSRVSRRSTMRAC